MNYNINFKSEKMELHFKDDVGFLTYKSLSKINFINHAFSTRLGGVSTGEFESMNLALNRGDDRKLVIENYRRFSKAAGFDFETLVASAQDHHTVVRCVTSKQKGIGITKPRDMESVDALVTNEAGVTLVTYYADCTPIFFVDTEKKVIALAHGGWRGTVNRICEKTILTMSENYGTNPKDIIAAVGPAISACCYEIDKVCADNFRNLKGVDAQRVLTDKGDGKYMADLLETNREILIDAGVPSENITVSDVCTMCNSDLLWSHRATKGKRGVMAAMMCIK